MDVVFSVNYFCRLIAPPEESKGSRDSSQPVLLSSAEAAGLSLNSNSASEASRVDRDLYPKFLVVPGFAPPKVGICDLKGSTFLQRLGP